jgi:hypothetical protein
MPFDPDIHSELQELWCAILGLNQFPGRPFVKIRPLWRTERHLVLSSRRGDASINVAAKASGINYRTAQRIVTAAAEHRQRQLLAIG